MSAFEAFRSAQAMEPVDIEITEDGVARAFTERHGSTMRFDHDAGLWLEWDGDHWKRDTTHCAFTYCRRLAREASEGASMRRMAAARKAAFAGGVERLARADPIHAVTQQAWDADPWLLGCPGVTIDLRDGLGRTPDPGDGITCLAAVAPAETADCSLWRAFLNVATGGDAAMMRFLQQIVGYCLTGVTREHALFFIYGLGGNGKSVFLNTVSSIIGAYATTAAMDTFVASKWSQHPTDLAGLRGARLVSASETEEGRAWAEARIKTITGGDPISARFMHKNFFTYRPQFKLVVTGNHKPVLRNVDDATRRRFNILPFEKKPQAPDKELEEKLKAEWPGILRWAIEGCLDWQAHGLIRPPSVLQATTDYFDEQDTFRTWLEDEAVVEIANTHRRETAKDLFESWRNYAKAAGEEPGNSKTFAANMRRHGLVAISKKIEGKTYRMWEGITLHRPTHAL
jgi:putative DNA primase/helicase